MTPLKTNKKVLTFLFVHLADVNVSLWRKLAYALFAVSVFATHVCAIASSAVHFSRFMSDDMGSALFGILQLGGHANMAYMLTIAVILRKKVTAIFDMLIVVYKTRERIQIRNSTRKS